MCGVFVGHENEKTIARILVDMCNIYIEHISHDTWYKQSPEEAENDLVARENEREIDLKQEKEK